MLMAIFTFHVRFVIFVFPPQECAVDAKEKKRGRRREAERWRRRGRDNKRKKRERHTD